MRCKKKRPMINRRRIKNRLAGNCNVCGAKMSTYVKTSGRGKNPPGFLSEFVSQFI